jgi:hypothetical protein
VILAGARWLLCALTLVSCLHSPFQVVTAACAQRPRVAGRCASTDTRHKPATVQHITKGNDQEDSDGVADQAMVTSTPPCDGDTAKAEAIVPTSGSAS